MFVWAMYAICVTLLLGGAALAAEHIARLRRTATRWVWCVALLGSVVLPLAMSFVAIDVPAPVNALESDVLRLRETTAASLSPERWLIALLGAGFQRLNAWAVDLWPYCSTVLALLLLALSAFWIRRRRTLPEVEVGGVKVHVAANLGPAVIGFLRPRIVLPRWLIEAGDAVCAGALAHERQHIAARDPQLLLVSLVVTCIMPWNLPMWWIMVRLRRAIEVDCDARVLREGHDVREYGALLLAVNQQQPTLALSAVSLTESHSFLETRIRLMLALRHRWWRWSLAGATAACALLLLLSVQVRPPDAASRREVAVEHRTFDRLAGYYHLGGLTVLRIERKGDELYATLPALAPWELRAHSNSEYSAAAEDARFSFVTRRDGTGVRVHLQRGGERYTAERVSDAMGQDLLSAFATKIRDQVASPGTQAAVQRIIGELQAGRPDYQQLSRYVAASMRDNLDSLRIELSSYGTLRAVTFDGVTQQGLDVYRVEFERALLRSEIRLAASGKVLRFDLDTWVSADVTDARAHRYQTQTAAPESERALRAFIATMQTGTPDYDSMESGLAAIVRQQAWSIQVGLASVGALQSITFDRVTPNGADTYSVRFERAVIECQILMGAGGKIQGLFWDT